MKAGFIPAVSKCVPPNATRRRMQRRGFRGGGLPHPRLVDQTRWGCRPDLLRPSPSAYLQTPPDSACNGGGSAGEACLPRALWGEDDLRRFARVEDSIGLLGLLQLHPVADDLFRVQPARGDQVQ